MTGSLCPRRATSLGAVVEIERTAVAPSAIDAGTMYVGLEHIDSDGAFVSPGPVNKGVLASTKFAFIERHVLYGKLRPYLRKVARPSFSGVCSTDILPILPGPDMDRDYLFHFLRSRGTVSLATARSEGVNLPRVSPKVLLGLPIELPPLAEQRRIAAVLDKADAIRRKRRESLRLLDELLEATYAVTVGWLNTDYAAWPVAHVADLAKDRMDSMRTGPFGSALRHSEFVDSGVAVLGIDNAVQNRFAWEERRFITNAKFEQFKRYAVKPGDVIITIMGTTGRSAVVPDNIPLAISTKHLAVITVDRTEVDPVFLSHAIHSDPQVRAQIDAASRGAIMAGLNLGIIKRLRLRVPPPSAQGRFAVAVARIDETRDRLTLAASEAERLFDSLAQRSFGRPR